MIDFRFYLITDRQRCAPRSLQSVVREACDAGVRAVQLREKDLTSEDLATYTKRLLDITRERNARLMLNWGGSIEGADVFLAASYGIDGLHFPDGPPFPHSLRARFPQLSVGISTHSLASAVAAATEGASLITFGPVFPTESRGEKAPTQGLERLREVCAASPLPVFAVGGITPDNAAECIAAGAHGVAAISSVIAANDVTAAVKEYEAALGGL